MDRWFCSIGLETGLCASLKIRIRACWYAASRSSKVNPCVPDPPEGDRDLLSAALAAALSALDMIRTGPLAGTGDSEVEDDEAADRDS